MGLEAATFINQLNVSWPVGASDPKGQGDDHLRLIKSALQATFPSITGAMTLTHTQLNNAAVKNEANVFTQINTFTGAQVLVSSAQPRYTLNETDGAANNRRWDLQAQAEQLKMLTLSDDESTSVAFLTVDRTLNVVDSIAFAATAMTVSAALNVTGQTTFSADPAGPGVIFQASGGGSSAAIQINAVQPSINFIQSGAAADNKSWDFTVISEQLLGRIINDANNVVGNWLTVDRTGTNVDSIVLSTTATFQASRFRSVQAAEALAITGADSTGDCYMAFYENQVYAVRKGFLGYGNSGDDTFKITNEKNAAMYFGTNAADRLVIEANGQIYGVAIHNNAGGAAGTANGYLASGTYTPTLTNVANVAGSTSAVCQWMRVGNVVTVSGSISIDPNVGGFTITTFGISLPIASNFTGVSQCGGTAVRSTTIVTSLFEGGRIYADAVNDRAECQFMANDTANLPMSFQFTYLVA